MDMTVQPTSESDVSTNTSDNERNHPVSSPQTLRDLPNPTTTEQHWNGDPMNWESWPTGRPGPVVLDTDMQDARAKFQSQDPVGTEEKVFHVAEYSSSGQGESDHSV